MYIETFYTSVKIFDIDCLCINMLHIYTLYSTTCYISMLKLRYFIEFYNNIFEIHIFSNLHHSYIKEFFQKDFSSVFLEEIIFITFSYVHMFKNYLKSGDQKDTAI